jgi:alpha-D-ribose 1-methylphosphonate 5-triphosphate synthase subunit PhnG
LPITRYLNNYWIAITTITKFVGAAVESHPEDVATTEGLRSARQRVHALIAKSPADAVRSVFDLMDSLPEVERLRPSEVGLVLVRGRVGGEGDKFNLGELPVARAALRIPEGPVGVGYVAGRNRDHAELAALADAMVQADIWRDKLETGVLEPLAAGLAERKADTARKAAATKVDFFTMVRTRGEK